MASSTIVTEKTSMEIDDDGGAPGPTGIQGRTDDHGNVLAYTITDDEQLMRFLILGSEGGNYYATETALTAQNVQSVTRLIHSGQGEMVVEKVVEVVKNGRCIRINAALLVLALCCRSEDSKTKSAAYQAILEVCNIPTHLFKFIEYMKQNPGHGEAIGWGRGLRKAVAMWYNKFKDNPQRLAMLVTKYRQREGWSHADVLRLSHVKPVNDAVGFILRYLAKGLKKAKKFYLEDGWVDMQDPQFHQIIEYLDAVEEVRCLQAPKRKEDGEELELVDDSSVQRAVTLVQQFHLVREHLPPPMLRSVPVWQSLLEKMPMMALIRNLNRMTLTGLLKTPDNLAKVLEKLGNREALKQSKVHPYAILTAWYIYRRGRGLKGKLTWQPVPEICLALEQAFYAAFGNVEATNKRILIALDVSCSMNSAPVVSPGKISTMTASVASTAMCLVTLHAEPFVDVVAFSNFLIPIQLAKDCKLEDALVELQKIHPLTTDCALPMVWAKDNDKQYDAFIIYTDNETWHSSVPPAEALRMYRTHSGIHNARLAVVGMSSGGFSVADPQDIYMMDVVGFDTDTPSVLREFVSGTLCE